MNDRNHGVEDTVGACIGTHTRRQAFEDGVLVDVSTIAKEAGFKQPVAMTRTVYDRYVEVPEELRGQHNTQRRIKNVLWMLWLAVTTNRIKNDGGEFSLCVWFPPSAEWESNEAPQGDARGRRLVTLKAVSGPADNGELCITIMRPTED